MVDICHIVMYVYFAGRLLSARFVMLWILGPAPAVRSAAGLLPGGREAAVWSTAGPSQWCNCYIA